MIPDSPIHGLLILDKPSGITSRAALDRAARGFPRQTKIGHTGTLDPLATGVLVLCLGTATRLAEYVQDMPKVYRTEFLLGVTSDTDDADGKFTYTADAVAPARQAIEAALAEFIGAIAQVPPAFSAAKISGRRAHDLARRGKEVSLQPRTVHIHGIDVLSYAFPRLELEVRCGKGTYIRSLARDLGKRLGCGALVSVLRRTQVGPFRAEDGLRLDADPATASACLLPLAAAVSDLPSISASAQDLERLSQGQVLAWTNGVAGNGALIAVVDQERRLAAIVRVDAGEKVLRPEKVLAR